MGVSKHRPAQKKKSAQRRKEMLAKKIGKQKAFEKLLEGMMQSQKNVFAEELLKQEEKLA